MVNSADIMQRKRAALDITSRPAWYIVRGIAEDTVKSMERAAIDEDDESKGANLRREAKAARKFLNTFLQEVEIATRVEDVPKDAPVVDEQYEVACE